MNQHDFTSSLVLIRLIADSIKAGMGDILEYIEHQNAFHVISKNRMSVMRQSMKSLDEEITKLEVASENVIFPAKGKNNE